VYIDLPIDPVRSRVIAAYGGHYQRLVEDRPAPPKPSQLPGTEYVNIQLPSGLAEAMKRIREQRHVTEGVDPKLSRIYREAVESYIPRIDRKTGLPKRRRKPSKT
jgi:hypothetical protein